MTDLSKLVLRSTPFPHVVQLMLNRLSKRNALRNELIAELAAAFRAAAQDENVRCVVISGAEGFFSAGADIKEMQQRGFEAIDNRARRTNGTDTKAFDAKQGNGHPLRAASAKRRRPSAYANPPAD